MAMTMIQHVRAMITYSYELLRSDPVLFSIQNKVNHVLSPSEELVKLLKELSQHKLKFREQLLATSNAIEEMEGVMLEIHLALEREKMRRSYNFVKKAEQDNEK